MPTYGYYGFDYYSLIFLLPGLLISMWAQFKVSSTFAKYSKIPTSKGVTGADVARALLRDNGLRDVTIERVQGRLTDHYDPRTNILRLSPDVYDSPSVAALGVAAHEVGHAMQERDSYSPLKLRSAFVPVASIGSRAATPLVIIGMLLSMPFLAYIGIIAFSLAVIFYIITLPVELNASRRALEALESGGYMDYNESRGAKKVLSAAAMTYIASALVAILQLLRLLSIVSGTRRRR